MYLNYYGFIGCMVLESLSSLENAEKHPVVLFFMAFLVSSAGLFLAFNSFPGSSSVLAIAFVAVAFMPILHSLFIMEEINEVDEKDVPFAFISTHFDVIHIYSWIFLGLIVAYAFWYAVLPMDNSACTGMGCLLPEKPRIFSEQNKVYSGITGLSAATGKVTGETECFNAKTKSFTSCFGLIFMNNAWVMALIIIFSFIWVAGAIFSIAWNASVIGTFIGIEITSKSVDAGIARAVSYLPHGIPEVMAYFVAAIMGGIISATISKRNFRKGELKVVLVDSLLLGMLALITLFIGAFIETAEIFAYWDVAVAGIVAFAALYIILYIPAVRYRINKIRKEAV